MADTPEPLIGQVIADRYLILSRIGEGGMGRVYLAEHVRMGRKSALKVINPALATTADAISRFNREAANACKINHPNVAQVYDFGETADGLLYLAMEYIEGETLEAIIAREGPLEIDRAARITGDIAAALHAAHHLGIVHRDLKPENVMVARHLDGGDWVKVVDFGIAKTVQHGGAGSQTVTTAGVSLGTPEYMSPEQLAGEPLDPRTDIYSLGLVLFHMLTGELPYPRVTSKEALVRRLVARPRTLAEVRPHRRWPAALQQVLDRALAPEVADRFASVADFGRAITAAAEAGRSPLSAARTVAVGVASPSAPNEVPRRRRKVVGAVVAVAAMLAIPTAYALIFRPAHASPASPVVPSAPKDTVAAMPMQQGSVARPDAAARADSVVRHDSVAPKPVKHSAHRTPDAPKPAAPKKDTLPKKPAEPSLEERSAAAANEIRAHIDRMKERFESGDLRGAREEFGMAASALPILRDLDPDPERVTAVQRELAQGVRELVAICYRKRADSTLAPNVRCESMRASLGRFRDGGARR